MIFHYLYVVAAIYTNNDGCIMCSTVFITPNPHLAKERDKKYINTELWTFHYDKILKLYWPVVKQPYVPNQIVTGAHTYYLQSKFGRAPHLPNLYLQYDILYDDWLITLYTNENRYSFGENMMYCAIKMNEWVTL